jgi:hypothetical protein
MVGGWLERPWRAPGLEPALQQLAEAERAARSAVDHAMVERPTDAEGIARLAKDWLEANDRLAEAIRERNARTGGPRAAREPPAPR